MKDGALMGIKACDMGTYATRWASYLSDTYYTSRALTDVTIHGDMTSAITMVAGLAGGAIARRAKFCFVEETPVVIGESRPEIVAANSTTEGKENASWNAPWLVAGVGLAAAAVAVRRKTRRQEVPQEGSEAQNHNRLSDWELLDPYGKPLPVGWDIA